jgi:hypothetical protein
MTRLSEFDEVEWRDVARKLRPDWTDEQFACEWASFQQDKAAHQKKAKLQ